jgi:hypothetical protein
MNNPNHNLFLHNVDRKNLISYLISYSLKTEGITFGEGESYPVYIGDLQQMQLIPQLFIPNLNIFNIMTYIDNNYGLFKTQSVKYFGLFGAYIFEMKEAIGTLLVKNKQSVLKVVQELIEDPTTPTSDNAEGIVINASELQISDNTIIHQTVNGDEVSLTSFNMKPDSPLSFR